MTEREELLDRKDDLMEMLKGCVSCIRSWADGLKDEDEYERRAAIEWVGNFLADAKEAHNELNEIQEKLDQLDEDDSDGKE